MLCYKWQNRTKKTFSEALASREYVLVRNALRVMARMIKVGRGGAAGTAEASRPGPAFGARRRI
jgi:hypothetical protein